jgi:hypothetical protein
LEDYLNKAIDGTVKGTVFLLRKTEAEVEVLRKDVTNQRILFSLGLLFYAVISTSITVEAIKNPNLYSLMLAVLILIGVPIAVLPGAYKQTLVMLDLYLRKVRAVKMVLCLRSALTKGEIKNEASK